jgi:hypothetical protein
MKNSIFTPRVSIDMLMSMGPSSKNKAVNTVIPYCGYSISIAMDSGHGSGDLSRSDIVVLDPNGNDVTAQLMSSTDAVQSPVPATAAALKMFFAAIDATNPPLVS